MNFRLKEMIIKKFGSQADFALAMKEHESVVSRVVRGRYSLPTGKRQKWAKALNFDVKEVFTIE